MLNPRFVTDTDYILVILDTPGLWYVQLFNVCYFDYQAY